LALDSPEALKSTVGGDSITIQTADGRGIWPPRSAKRSAARRLWWPARSGSNNPRAMSGIARLVEAFPVGSRPSTLGKPTLEDCSSIGPVIDSGERKRRRPVAKSIVETRGPSPFWSPQLQNLEIRGPSPSGTRASRSGRAIVFAIRLRRTTLSRPLARRLEPSRRCGMGPLHPAANRVFGAGVQPLIFWILFGAGLGKTGGVSYKEYSVPHARADSAIHGHLRDDLDH